MSIYPLDVVALMFGVSKRRVWDALSKHRDQLDPPYYRRRGKTLYRYVTQHDVDFLRHHVFRVWMRAQDVGRQ